MSTSGGQRIYLPLTLAVLAEAYASYALAPGQPARVADGLDEEAEHLALTEAAQDALLLLGTDDEPARVVLVAEVAEPMAAVAWTDLRAVHVDAAEAAPDVAAAREALLAGDDGAAALVDRCLDHELLWYAVQEVPAVLSERLPDATAARTGRPGAARDRETG